MKLKIKTIRCVHKNENYQIFGCDLLEPNEDIVLNKYGNISLKDNTLVLSEGKEYVVEVKGVNGKYGMSYEVLSIPSMQIDDIDTITDDMELDLLKEITTDSQSNFVHQAYPNFIRLILRGEQDKIDVNKIYNVGEYRLNSYIRSINEKFKYYYIMEQNRHYELSINDCKALCKIYPTVEKVNKMLDEVPYFCLISVCGRSFTKADKMIMEVRDDLGESSQRTEFMILDVLKRNESEGSTYMDANEMAQYVNGIDSRLVKKLKDVSVDSELIYYEDKTKRIAIASTYMAECMICDTLNYLIENPIDYNLPYQKYQGDLTDEQLQLLKYASEKNIVLLTGGSGSGKTHTAKSLINMLDDNNLTYTLVAPTGVSAKRLRQSTGRKASTIHRGILPYITIGETISSDYLICDEFGMCGVELTSWLCKALNTHTKLVLICDDAQLTSIQCGNCLTDILKSGRVPTVKLTKIFRYGIGSLTTVATDIRNGKTYLSDGGEKIFVNPNNNKDYEFIPIGDNPLQQVVEQYEKLLKKYSFKDILVLTPFNVGDFGTLAINNAIQELINPPRPNEEIMEYTKSGFPIRFRVGDKVLNTVNTYDALTQEKMEYQIAQENSLKDDDNWNEDLQPPKQVDIMNGDIGYIRSIKDKKMYVQFDENIVIFTPKDIYNLLLSYSVSIHKIQGGQSQAVITVYHTSHKKMLTKNLIYVGDTRSQEKLIEIADAQTINEALHIVDTANRNTWLGDLLNEN